MSNLEGSYGTELEPIILLHELEDTQKTDEEVSLNSEKKLKNLPPTRTPSLEAAFNNSQIRTKLQGENHEVILDNLVDWVIMECQAFRVVDSSSFKELIASLNPEFQVPSRQTLRKKIVNKYEQNKKVIIKLIQVKLS